MKPYFLRFHRWIALLFSVPLLAIVCTGLVLSFEPWLVTRAIQPGLLTAARIEELLTKHNSGGQARAISFRSYDGTLTIGGGRGASGIVVDVASGAVQAAASRAASILGMSRGLHETLLLDMRWLVIGSTIAMIVVIALGVFMGWPRFANTLGGWHRGVAWILLPLLVLSPISGLMMSAGMTMANNAPVAASARQASLVTLLEAVQALGKDHDLSGLVWLRPQGGRTVARLVEDGEYKVFAVSADGASAMPRNWPRLWHEGNFAGALSALMNIAISVALLVLLATGFVIWLRRQRRRHVRSRSGPVMTPAA